MQDFDDELAPCGYKQNHDKLVAVLCLNGSNSGTELRKLRSGHTRAPFKCTLVTRSLGSMLIHDASASAEIQCRLGAVQRSFYERGKIWTTRGVHFMLLRLHLIADIQGAALSGLEAFVLTPRQYGMLDSAVAKVARVALKGKAVLRGEEGTVHKGLSNEEVLRHFRLTSAATELAIRRLKWMQQMARHPAGGTRIRLERLSADPRDPQV